MSDIKLDVETADRIALCSIKEHYVLIKKDVDETDVLDLKPYQAEDYAYNLRLLKAMEVVLKYYGEEV